MVLAFRALQSWAARAADLSGAFAPEGTAAPARCGGRRELRRLPAGAVVGFALHEQVRITCLGGELWVTGPGTGDQILSAGQSVSIAGHGRVVAEALRDARFVVVHAASPTRREGG